MKLLSKIRGKSSRLSSSFCFKKINLRSKFLMRACKPVRFSFSTSLLNLRLFNSHRLLCKLHSNQFSSSLWSYLLSLATTTRQRWAAVRSFPPRTRTTCFQTLPSWETWSLRWSPLSCSYTTFASLTRSRSMTNMRRTLKTTTLKSLTRRVAVSLRKRPKSRLSRMRSRKACLSMSSLMLLRH